MKKQLSLLLTLVLALLALTPAAIADAADYTYTVNEDGTATLTGYTGKDTRLTLPAELDGHAVTAIGDEAFAEEFNAKKGLAKVVVPDGVTSIGNNAFRYCMHLRTVVLPEGLLSIGSSAFVWCEELTSINLPDSVTALGEGAFSSCFNSGRPSCPRA